MCSSDARALFESRNYERWAEGKKVERSNVVAISTAIGVVVHAINNLMKQIAAIRRF